MQETHKSRIRISTRRINYPVIQHVNSETCKLLQRVHVEAETWRCDAEISSSGINFLLVPTRLRAAAILCYPPPIRCLPDRLIKRIIQYRRSKPRNQSQRGNYSAGLL